MDPNRSRQVAIWGTIFSQSINSSRSEGDHQDFISRQFERLNAIGFDWTEDSMREVALQIPSSPYVPEPFRLMDLPTELIITMVDCIHSMSQLYLENLDPKKLTDLVHPIFATPFAKLALTSRTLYEFCCPYLWRTITMPGSKTGVSDMWTDCIFPKHGHLVKDLHLELFDDSIPIPKHSELDRLVIKYDTSASKAIEFLNHCPNLTQLYIEYWNSHCLDENETLDRTEAYLARLIPAIADLKNLRDLTVENNEHEWNLTLSDFTPTLLEKLPSLEILKLEKIPVPGPNHQAGALGSVLSQMKSLKDLWLDRVGDISEAWCQYPWQNQITDLVLNNCNSQDTLSIDHQIINHIGPHLKNLSFYPATPVEPLGWGPRKKFLLPELSILEFESKFPSLLSSFRDCKALTDITFKPYSFEHYTTMDDLIRQNTWPKLKRLETYSKTVENQQEKVTIKEFIQTFTEFCGTQNIETRFRRPLFRGEDSDQSD